MRRDMVFGLNEVEAVIVECETCHSELRFDMNQAPAEVKRPSYISGICPICQTAFSGERRDIKPLIKTLLAYRNVEGVALSVADPSKG